MTKKQQREELEHKKQVLEHKKILEKTKSKYIDYKNVAFVIQTFNKGSQSKKVLSPLIARKCANIIVFADGCIDKSALIWHEELKGKNHLVIAANDLHEISNYRLSIQIASEWKCEYVVLMQDDDFYDHRLFEWLDSAIAASDLYNGAIVGGNSGNDIDEEFDYKVADEGLCTAVFRTEVTMSGKEFFQLSDYKRMLLKHKLYETNNLLPHRFYCSVNRAPQLIDIAAAKHLSFFPRELEPYQYDDYFNCFTAWINGYSVINMPLSKLGGCQAIGGMRRYNDVNVNKRPIHFADNWNYILNQFSSNFSQICSSARQANVLHFSET